MRERMDWRAKRILPENFSPHSQPSFPEPLTINDLQKQGWIWVPRNAPKSRAPYYNSLIIKGSINKVLAVGWKTCPAPETGAGSACGCPGGGGGKREEEKGPADNSGWRPPSYA